MYRNISNNFFPAPGKADSSSVTVQTDLHHDPQPAAGGGAQSDGHDEEELFWEPQERSGNSWSTEYDESG